MPKPEIVMSSAFGMGFWIDEDGTFMSCPAFEYGSFDIDNAVPVEDWDDFSVYSLDHMQIPVSYTHLTLPTIYSV